MKRLPIIRHLRYFWHARQVRRHYEMWTSLGSLPVYADNDYAVLDKIWRGEL